ncbi:MAG TPA: hypothetical protein PL078_03215 [Bacillota bacterium]|jgi:hypothetical protein|nr:hypothetical protein [Peptococcaceae bacterium MAG4]NLW38336.1 hypothetical protein [Peptococcaceae bacterium]HPZ42993.1 hypothetical protein [Bacillota bacterium]HQD75381.1 hypothetical protein [Bacillota bacterium]HUM58116.1 hypothetical protein [Bacillota bacterium]
MQNLHNSGVPGISFPPRSLEILKLLSEKGGMLCTGSCHAVKPGQIHCRQIGKILEVGFNKVWDSLTFFINNGLVSRKKFDDKSTLFIVTPKGEEVLKKIN